MSSVKTFCFNVLHKPLSKLVEAFSCASPAVLPITISMIMLQYVLMVPVHTNNTQQADKGTNTFYGEQSTDF